MPLKKLLKDFNFDAELIARDRKMSVGMAKAHERTAMEVKSNEGRWFVHMMAAATEYRRAGAHSILLSDREMSAKMFDQAGRIYTNMRRPYGLMMFWCALGMDDVLEHQHQFDSLQSVDRTQVSYLLLTSAAGGETKNYERLQVLTATLAGSHATPIGVLGVPVGAYVDLSDTLLMKEPAGSMMLEALLPFLLMYSTAIRRCVEDEYHWERMIFPFHPAEPDVLSVIFCVESALRRRQQGSLLSLLEGVPLFHVAGNLLYNAIIERFGDEH